MVNYTALERTAHALANNHRLVIIDALSTGPKTSSELAAVTSLRLNALAKHLTPLAQAGLITSNKTSRTVTHTLQPAPLAAMASWTAARSRFWTQQLSTLAETFEESP